MSKSKSKSVKRKCDFDCDDKLVALEPIVDGKLINPGAAAVNYLDSPVRKVKAKMAKIVNAMQALDNMEGHLVHDRDKAHDELKACKAELLKKCNVVTEKDAEIGKLARGIETLQEQVAAKDCEIQELKQRVATMDSENAVLKESVASKVSEIEEMKGKVASVEDGVSELLSKIRDE